MNNLKAIRVGRGLTQSELVELMIERGVNYQQTWVSKVERGTRDFRGAAWVVVSEILDCDLRILLGAKNLECVNEQNI